MIQQKGVSTNGTITTRPAQSVALHSNGSVNVAGSSVATVSSAAGAGAAVDVAVLRDRPRVNGEKRFFLRLCYYRNTSAFITSPRFIW